MVKTQLILWFSCNSSVREVKKIYIIWRAWFVRQVYHIVQWSQRPQYQQMAGGTLFSTHLQFFISLKTSETHFLHVTAKLCFLKSLSQKYVFFTGEGVAEVVVTSRQGAAGGDDAWVVMFVKWTVDSMFSAMWSSLARSDRIEKRLGLVKLLWTTTFSHIVLALIVSGVLVVSGVFWPSL